MGLLTILLVIGAFYPKNGIYLFGHDFHFFSIMDEEKIKKEEVSEVIIKINLDSLVLIEQAKKDSLNLALEVVKQQILDSILSSQKNIQYPNNDKSILYPFFKKLENAKNKKVRIMHYGDSQIEADRITSRLREKLQKTFGGWGAGAFSIVPATRKLAVKTEYSSNWERKTGFGSYIDTAIKHKNYGALFAFCKYNSDSIINSGELDIYKPKNASRHSQEFQQLNIYYTNKDSNTLKVNFESSTVYEQSLQISDNIEKISLDFNLTPSKLTVQFNGSTSPLIYGLSIEGKEGVVVDNIPMRGASGTEFAKVDYVGLKQMHQHLDPSLIILEYGGNAIPYMKTKERCERYGRWFKKQIQKLQKINPDALIIVIGPGDMSTKQKTELITYPILPDVRDALRNAAFETNSCFWDMYLNMGGQNSIQEWTKENPALAAKDYIHFTRLGARKVADMFIDDLMNDYSQYKNNKTNE